MDESKVLEYADIKPDGSVLLGKHIVCDGANYGRKIGVFTRIHTDHTRLFNKATQECSQIYTTIPTLDMLFVLEQGLNPSVSAQNYFRGRHIRALDYDSSIRPKVDPFLLQSDYADTITLYPSHHILGSAQVLVKTTDGIKIVYTGDFGSDAKPIPCDILVLDSTHGSPMFDIPVDQSSLERRLLEYVDEEIQNGKNILIRAHRGRLQYTMHILHKYLPEQIKFLAHPNDIKLCSVYKKYRMNIRNCTNYNSIDGQGTQDGDSAYVEFRTHGAGNNTLEGTNKMAVFNLGGRFPGSSTTMKKNGNYKLEFMDHADYGSIIEYVKKANPKHVITDYARGNQGKGLATAIQNIGIDAIARPVDMQELQ